MYLPENFQFLQCKAGSPFSITPDFKGASFSI
jgi:hypothetical protein